LWLVYDCALRVEPKDSFPVLPCAIDSKYNIVKTKLGRLHVEVKITSLTLIPLFVATGYNNAAIYDGGTFI
jgi:hypothetical protein